MTKTLLTICPWAALCWLIGSWLNPTVGWGMFTAGLLAMIMVSSIQLNQISRWVKNIESPPPPSVGPWDEPLAVIYRKLRANRLEIDEQSRHLDSIMLAAEALP